MIEFWIAACQNSMCAVLTYKWKQVGDQCPSCSHIGAPCGGAVSSETVET